VTDRQLLVAAAKAAGDVTCYLDPKEGDHFTVGYGEAQRLWDPLGDDGDALRLAVNLRLDLYWSRDQRDRVMALVPNLVHWGENGGSDPRLATRRVVVCAAAALWNGRPHD
jgi:hypothetical protein